MFNSVSKEKYSFVPHAFEKEVNILYRWNPRKKDLLISPTGQVDQLVRKGNIIHGPNVCSDIGQLKHRLQLWKTNHKKDFIPGDFIHDSLLAKITFFIEFRFPNEHSGQSGSGTSSCPLPPFDINKFNATDFETLSTEKLRLRENINKLIKIEYLLPTHILEVADLLTKEQISKFTPSQIIFLLDKAVYIFAKRNVITKEIISSLTSAKIILLVLENGNEEIKKVIRNLNESVIIDMRPDQIFNLSELQALPHETLLKLCKSYLFINKFLLQYGESSFRNVFRRVGLPYLPSMAEVASTDKAKEEIAAIGPGLIEAYISSDFFKNENISFINVVSLFHLLRTDSPALQAGIIRAITPEQIHKAYCNNIPIHKKVVSQFVESQMKGIQANSINGIDICLNIYIRAGLAYPFDISQPRYQYQSSKTNFQSHHPEKNLIIKELFKAKNSFIQQLIKYDNSLSSTLSFVECQRLYKRLTVLKHPDKNAGNDVDFKIIYNAWSQLKAAIVKIGNVKTEDVGGEDYLKRLDSWISQNQ